LRKWYQNPAAWQHEPMPEDGKPHGSGQSQTDEHEDTMWTFEPSTALAIYERWLNAHDIPVVYGERLDREGEAKSANRGDGFWVAQPGTLAKGVIKDGTHNLALVMESGHRVND